MTRVIRSLAKSPGFTTVAILTLALGIGVNASMFSIVDVLLFRSAPYPQSDRLMLLTAVTRNGQAHYFSEPEIREIRGRVQAFESLTAAFHVRFAMTERGHAAERVHAVCVSGGMADTFRVQPILGRLFASDEFEPGRNHVVLLSETFWRSHFGGDPNVVGRTVRLDDDAVTIIGVMPARFDYRVFWGNVSIWRPLNYTRDQELYRADRSFELIGRLRPGATPEEVASQLAPLAAQLQKTYPQDYPALRFQPLLLRDATIDSVGTNLTWMLLGMSCFVMLIACANLANLQLARATESIRDFAIRAALGASALRLIMQQLIEAVVLALIGCAVGVVIALWINALIGRQVIIDGASGFEIPMNAPVILAAIGFSVVSGILFGIVPALFAARTNVGATLKSQSRGSTGSRDRHRFAQALIVGEIALALVLLGGAAVLNRGFSRFLQNPTGWDTHQVLTASLSMPETRFDTGDKRIAFYRQVLARIDEIPGVQSTSLSSALPLFDYGSEQPVFADAVSAGRPENPMAAHVMVTPDYFTTLRIPLLAGRTFPSDIKASGPPYIVVSETLARHFWPGQSAIGRRLGVMDDVSGKNVLTWREVIGVVGDVDPAVNFRNPSTLLAVYRPLVQAPWSRVCIALRSMRPATLVETLRRAVAEVDPDLPADQVMTVGQFVDRNQHNIYLVNELVTGFAALGMVLAAIGLYGIISHVVAQRTSEFGIRMALGAQPADVLRSVLNRGARLAAIGIAVGIGGAYGLARFLYAILPRLAQPDPLALAATILLLFAVTLAASWIPARRATKVDPVVALRAE